MLASAASKSASESKEYSSEMWEVNLIPPFAESLRSFRRRARLRNEPAREVLKLTRMPGFVLSHE